MLNKITMKSYLNTVTITEVETSICVKSSNVSKIVKMLGDLNTVQI